MIKRARLPEKQLDKNKTYIIPIRDDTPGKPHCSLEKPIDHMVVIPPLGLYPRCPFCGLIVDLVEGLTDDEQTAFVDYVLDTLEKQVDV